MIPDGTDTDEGRPHVDKSTYCSRATEKKENFRLNLNFLITLQSIIEGVNSI